MLPAPKAVPDTYGGKQRYASLPPPLCRVAKNRGATAVRITPKTLADDGSQCITMAAGLCWADTFPMRGALSAFQPLLSPPPLREAPSTRVWPQEQQGASRAHVLPQGLQAQCIHVLLLL